MKKCFVHRCPRENRSGLRAKQAAALALAVLLIAAASAQNFPDAEAVLANVRLHQSTQRLDLRGQLRQDATVVPFELVQNGPVIRYIFRNPDQTFELRLGANDSELEQLGPRSGTHATAVPLDEHVRGTAITFEDLSLRFLYWPGARIIGADFIRTRNCWKLALTAPANESQYGNVTLWVDKDGGALMRMEAADRAGRLLRRFEVVSAQKIGDRWYLKQMRIEAIDAASGKVTGRTYLEIINPPS